MNNANVETVTYTATDTASSITIEQTITIEFAPGATSPSSSTLIASVERLFADGKSESTLTITLKDNNGHLLQGHEITLSQGTGSSSISPLSATTNAEGEVVFTVTNKKAENITYSAVDETAGVTLAQTATVRFMSLPVVLLPISTIDLNGIPFDPANLDLSKPSITLEVQPKNGSAYVSIPASILSSFANRNATLFIVIQAPYGSYQIPVNLASLIPGLEELLANNNLKSEDISFKITLSDNSDNKALQAAFANDLPNGNLLGSMVDYHIEIINTRTGQLIGTADQFSKALLKIIPMPKNLASMPEQWGAFRYNETAKQWEFVPAKATQIDGIWYVTMRSYSNSVYVVAEHPASFTDVQQHWAQPYVEKAAAKDLVKGIGGGLFDPNTMVTRAEFTAMLVRSLGRYTSVDDADAITLVTLRLMPGIREQWQQRRNWDCWILRAETALSRISPSLERKWRVCWLR